MSRVTGSRLSDVPDRLFEPEVVVGCLDVDWQVLWQGGLDWGLRVLLPKERGLEASVGIVDRRSKWGIREDCQQPPRKSGVSLVVFKSSALIPLMFSRHESWYQYTT